MFGAAASMRHIAGTSGSSEGSLLATNVFASNLTTAGGGVVTGSMRGSLGSTTAAASTRGNGTEGNSGA